VVWCILLLCVACYTIGSRNANCYIIHSTLQCTYKRLASCEIKSICVLYTDAHSPAQYSDTLVMQNLGYFQLQANPGLFALGTAQVCVCGSCHLPCICATASTVAHATVRVVTV
jgi:hypothetical protein